MPRPCSSQTEPTSSGATSSTPPFWSRQVEARLAWRCRCWVTSSWTDCVNSGDPNENTAKRHRLGGCRGGEGGMWARRMLMKKSLKGGLHGIKPPPRCRFDTGLQIRLNPPRPAAGLPPPWRISVSKAAQHTGRTWRLLLANVPRGTARREGVSSARKRRSANTPEH